MNTITIQPNYILFKNNKYTKWYYYIINNALNRSSTRKEAKELLGYVEGHHIIPRSLGGTNENNIAILTAKEHFICHLLLCKMCIERNHEYKMLNAITKMQSIGRGQHRYTSINYSYFKVKFAKFKSETQQGENNPNFGNKWSNEQKQRMSEIVKNRMTDEYRKILSEARKNRPPMSEETKRKLSVAGKGRIVSNTTKKIISDQKKGSNNPMYGNSNASAHLKKYSENKKGTIRSESETHNIKLSLRLKQCIKVIKSYGEVTQDTITQAKKFKVVSKLMLDFDELTIFFGISPSSFENLKIIYTLYFNGRKKITPYIKDYFEIL